MIATLLLAVTLPHLPDSHIADQAGLLIPSDVAALAVQLRQSELDSGAKLAVLTLSDLDDEPKAVAVRAINFWQLGRRSAVLLVSTNPKKIYVQPGDDLVGALDSVTATRIASTLVAPRLKARQIAAGLSVGVQAMAQAIVTARATNSVVIEGNVLRDSSISIDQGGSKTVFTGPVEFRGPVKQMLPGPRVVTAPIAWVPAPVPAPSHPWPWWAWFLLVAGGIAVVWLLVKAWRSWRDREPSTFQSERRSSPRMHVVSTAPPVQQTTVINQGSAAPTIADALLAHEILESSRPPPVVVVHESPPPARTPPVYTPDPTPSFDFGSSSDSSGFGGGGSDWGGGGGFDGGSSGAGGGGSDW